MKTLLKATLYLLIGVTFIFTLSSGRAWLDPLYSSGALGIAITSYGFYRNKKLLIILGAVIQVLVLSLSDYSGGTTHVFLLLSGNVLIVYSIFLFRAKKALWGWLCIVLSIVAFFYPIGLTIIFLTYYSALPLSYMWALVGIIVTIGFATAYCYRWLVMPVIFYPACFFILDLGKALARDVEHDHWGSIDPGFYFFQHYLGAVSIMAAILSGLILNGRRPVQDAGVPKAPMDNSL